MEELGKKLDDLKEIQPTLFSAIQDDIKNSSNNYAGSETSQTRTQNASSPVSIPLSLLDSTLRTSLFKKLCRSVGITLNQEQKNSLNDKADNSPPYKIIDKNVNTGTGKIIYEIDTRPLPKQTYDATVVGSKEKYTITLEDKLDMKNIKEDNISIFPTDKSNKIFFIVALNKIPPTKENKSPKGSYNEYHYVSSRNTESFVEEMKKMKKNFPDATLAIAGWMEKSQISPVAHTTE